MGKEKQMVAKIYTRTGDSGSTSLLDGSRVPKDALRVEAYGTVDEATSWVGAARAFVSDDNFGAMLEFVQHRLYNCSSYLAAPSGVDFELPSVHKQDIDWLERAIDSMQRQTGGLKSFVLPGGSKASAFLHLARTVCRRAERRVVSLNLSEEVDEQILRFINRVSDFLFAAARYANFTERGGDVDWVQDFTPPCVD